LRKRGLLGTVLALVVALLCLSSLAGGLSKATSVPSGATISGLSVGGAAVNELGISGTESSFIGTSSAATLWVDNDWADNSKVPENLVYGENAFASITEAVTVAVPGDEIVVMPGIYDSSIEKFPICISKGLLTLRSLEGPENTIIRGENLPEIIAIQITADNVVIEGFTLYDFKTGRNTGIITVGGNGCVIKNNVLMGNLGEGNAAGIYVSKNSCIIANNVFRNNLKDINLDGGMYNVVENNVGDSVIRLCKGSGNNIITHNVFQTIAYWEARGTDVVMYNTFTKPYIYVRLCEQAPTWNYNNILGGHVGLRYAGGGVVSGGARCLHAEYNWWGHHSGPSGVGPGRGAGVDDENVKYEPWLFAPVGTEPNALAYDMSVVLGKENAGVGEHISVTLSVRGGLYLFSTDEAGMSENLNQEKIPEELKNRFVGEGYQLSESASLSVIRDNEIWKISDEDHIYIIEKVDTKLNIYEVDENLRVVPSIVASPYYRANLESNQLENAPAEWTFKVWPTELAAGRDNIKIRFEVYAEHIWNAFGPVPMVRRSATLHVLAP